MVCDDVVRELGDVATREVSRNIFLIQREMGVMWEEVEELVRGRVSIHGRCVSFRYATRLCVIRVYH